MTANELTESGGGSAEVWDIASDQRVLTLAGHTQRVFTAYYSPDTRLIATASRDFTARIWEAATGQELRAFLNPEGAVFDPAFNQEGTLLAATN